MKALFRCLLVILISFVAINSFAQDATESYLKIYKDSLKIEKDTARVIRFRKIGDYYVTRTSIKNSYGDSALLYWHNSLALATQADMKHLLAMTALSLSRYYFRTAQPDSAIYYHNKSVSTWQQIRGDIHTRDAWLWITQNAPRTERTFDIVLQACDTTIKYYKSIDSVRWVVPIQGYIAYIHFLQGKLDQAEKEFDALITRSKELNYNYVHFYYNYASQVARYKGNYSKTIAMAQLAIDNLVFPRDSAYAFTYYRDLGELYANTGPKEKFLEYSIKAVEMRNNKSAFQKGMDTGFYLSRRDGKLEESVTYMLKFATKNPPENINQEYALNSNLAQGYLELRQFDKAEEKFMRLIELEKILARPYHADAVYLDYYLAQLYINWGKFKNAEPYLSNILKRPTGTYPMGLKREAHYMSYRVDSAQGNYKNALDHLIEYKKLFDKITSETSTWQFQELATKYETRKKEDQLKSLSDSNKYQQAQLRILNDSILADTRLRQLEELKRSFDASQKDKNFRLLNAKHLLSQARLIALSDSITTTEQLRQYAITQDSLQAVQREQNIKLLRSETKFQQKELSNAKLQRNLIFFGIILMAIIAGMLAYFFKSKQKTNYQIQMKNATLERLLEEKEWLLKEVHHRVKNNLHTVVSLLESQSAFLADEALAAVINSQNRVYTMSLIHQKLYKSGDVTTIDMSVYLPELIQYVAESYDLNKKLRFVYHIAAVKLNGSCAVPVGLIVNEAVTNSMKYAFKNIVNPTLTISLDYQKDGTILLSIADNGPGISDIHLASTGETLGIKLMRGLSMDIGGQLDIFNKDGAVINLTIPAEQVTSNALPGAPMITNLA